jgi:hypothetical protein
MSWFIHINNWCTVIQPVDGWQGPQICSSYDAMVQMDTSISTYGVSSLISIVDKQGRNLITAGTNPELPLQI